MPLDLATQVSVISRFVGFQGTPGDLISRGSGPFFHYTDTAAFGSIVMNSDLWLTDARCSNDAEEMEHGRTLVLAVLAELQSAPPGNAFAAAVAQMLTAPQDPVYICCFCEKGDLLSQWRGYGGSGGVAIEIEPRAFSYLTGMDCPIGVMRFWKVFYDEAAKRQRVQDVLSYWAGQADPPDFRAQAAAATLGFFLPTFKNPTFAEEAEWRLIFTPGPNCKVLPRFRSARGLLVPYFELIALVRTYAPPDRLAIKSVRIGPGPYKEVNQRSARMLLDSYASLDATVTVSDIPYRG